MTTSLARRFVHALLSRTRDGEIVLVEDDTPIVFGCQGLKPDLRVTVHVRDPRFHRALARGGIGMGTSYMDGWWDCDDLVSLIRIAARNVHRFDALRRRFRFAIGPLQHAQGLVRRNTVARSRAQIAAHYDLGNDLYEVFLDETMMYSAAFFDGPQTTLADAQRAKLDRLCAKLALAPGDHLLEIGTGWGGLAVHAAAKYGCRVTTTTISREQHALATERVRAAGLEDRVTVLLEDYRDLRGSYDKLVSVEMIEAVGWRDFGTFFERCSALLADDGLMALQAITIDDRAYDVEKATKSFINQLVFPGGCLPSLRVIARCVARHTDLRAVQQEDLTEHYVTTLRHWRARFAAAVGELDARGYDARFRRLWELYLSYCEGGFAERRIGVHQIVLAKPGSRAEPRFAVAVPERAPTPGPGALRDDAIAA